MAEKKPSTQSAQSQTGCVYLAKNKINGKGYVGKTARGLATRKREHLMLARSKLSQVFHRAVKKHGVHNFEWIVLFESNDSLELNEKEMEFIRSLRTKSPLGYNMTDGGEGTAGVVATIIAHVPDDLRTVPSMGGYDFSGYFARCDGEIFSVRRCGKLRKVKSHRDSNGYRVVQLTAVCGTKRYIKVHRAVLSAFTEAKSSKTFVIHIDGNRSNNKLSNLTWGTAADVAAERNKQGLCLVADKHKSATMTNAQVIQARNRCRAGELRTDVARSMGVKISALSAAVAGTSWKSLDAQCPPVRGMHLHGDMCRNAIFTAAQVVDMRTRFDAGESIPSIAQSHDANRGHVWSIVRRKIWRNQ